MTDVIQKKFWSAMAKAIFDSDLVATRLTLATAEFAWAVMLFWPGDTFERPTYALMGKVMSEEAWSVIFLASAVTQLSIVLLEDYYSRTARYFAAWNAALWGYVVVSMLVSVFPPPAAIGGELALALSAFWIFVRPYILTIGYHRAAGFYEY